jgi:hydrogenase maturation protease
MNPEPSPRILVIGIGNPYRHDDVAGLQVARKLKEVVPDFCHVVEHSGEGAALMELWKAVNYVILIDAVRSGAQPGTIHRLDASLQPLPSPMFRDSTHAFAVVEAIELARALHQLPAHCVVYGIEGQDFQAGIGLSTPVERAARDVIERLQMEIKAMKDAFP